MKDVLVLGLGAIGASIAAQFTDANYPIKVLCDTGRKERYQQNGIMVNNKKYHFNYITKKEYDKVADLILIAVKYYDLKDVISQLDPLIGEKTVLLSLLNGIDSEEIIAERFGYDNITHSFIYKIDATKKDNDIHYLNPGIVVFGNQNRQTDKKTDQVQEIFDAAKINYELSDHIIKRMWWKYMVNMGINQTTAVLKAPYRILQEVSYAKALARAAMTETVLISQKMEINLSQEDIDQVMEMMMHFDPDGRTSMCQDVEANRKTEVEMFSGKLCQLGRRYQVPTPVNQTFYRLLKSIETMY